MKMLTVLYQHFAGDQKNFARNRQATQSSTFAGMNASNAVDGNNVDDSSSSHTSNHDYYPWWKVQLDYPTWVINVEITNRHD